MDVKLALQRALEELGRQRDEIARQRVEIDSFRRAATDPIAIIGMACRFPGGADTPAAFWDLLDRGVDTVTDVPRDRWNADAFYDADPSASGKMTTRCGAFIRGADRFDPQFFGIAPREALSMDPQQRILLEVVWEALEHANIAPTSLYGSATGVFVGITCFDHAIRLSQSIEHFNSYAGTGSALNMAPGRVSYVLGLTGPSLAVDTACSSSLVGLHLACQSLRQRESSLALVGGVHLMLSPDVMVSFSQARMLAADGRSKTFDASADGYSRGEGCGVVVLKRLADAQADRNTIVGLVRGTAVNQDGPSGGLTVPNGAAQQAVIRRALAAGNVGARDVAYVEAHGTGTSLGDPIEVEALAGVYGEGRAASDPLLIGAAKTNIGHLEPAAGIAGLIKILLAFEHEQIPRHLHFHTPNPHVAWSALPVTVVADPVPWPRSGRARIAGLSAFGFSGTNAHVIVEEPPRSGPDGRRVAAPFALFTLSAKSDEALTDAATRYAEYLAADVPPDLASVCYTAATGRTHFPHRLAIVAATVDGLRDALRAFAADRWRVVGQGFSRAETAGATLEGRPTDHLADNLARVVHGKASNADYRLDARAFQERLSRTYDRLRAHPDRRDSFDDLATLYVDGASIDWDRVYGFDPPARVTLPSYPFQRQRYWIETSTHEALNAAPPPGQYELAWQKVGAGDAARTVDAARRWVIVPPKGKPNRGADGLAGAVSRVLHERSGSAVLADVSAAAALAPTDIIYLSGIRTSPEEAADSCADLLALVQDLLRGRGAAPRIWIVTRGAVPVDGTLDMDGAAQAPLAAFAKVVGLEHPELFGRLIDLDPRPDGGDAGSASALAGEVLQQDAEDHVAIRRGDRYAPRVVSIERAGGIVDTPPTHVRGDATYLITGGLGALGLHVAAWLASRGARHLWLVGRTAPATATQRAALAAIEALGVAVRVLTVDVAERAQVAALLEDLRAHVPPLRGIVHAAGVAGYVDLARLTREEVHAVLRPKVHGALLVHELTRGTPLDFFVGFSSIASAWGSRGQAHYAAANAFLDGLAHARRTAGLPAVAINWGPWADGGMGSADADTLLRRVGVRPLATHDAIASLDTLAASDRAQVIVADIDWRLFKGSYESRGHRRLLERLSVPTSAPAGTDGELAAQLESVAAGDREQLLVGLVQTEVAQVLGLPSASRPDPDQGLFEMGMDSLMALELRTRLETRAARALPATLVFDCPAIRAIARFLLAQMAGASRGAGDTVAAASLAATHPTPQTTGAAKPLLDVSELSDQDAEALLLDKLESLESIE